MRVLPCGFLVFSIAVQLASAGLVDFSNCKCAHIKVGSVEGKCCIAGRRYGCAISNFSGCSYECNPCNWVRPCPTFNAPEACTAASCSPGQSEETCETNTETVGQNKCKNTLKPCGRVWLPQNHTLECVGTNQSFVGPGWFDSYYCQPSEASDWKSGQNNADISVCDSSYSICDSGQPENKCEGREDPPEE